MDNNFVPYLCGGVLFSFLIELHNNTTEKFNNTWKDKNVITQPELMKKLIYAITPNYSYNTNAEISTFKKTVSQYHTCKTDGGNIIPFERDATKTEFDNSVKNQYDEVLERIKEFTSECFPRCNDTAMRRLVEQTLILIRDDTSIKNDIHFFINEDGSPISKEELLIKEDFNFQSFLVGIWHYIITNPTKNTNGKETFEKLFPKCNDRERKLDISCLEKYGHNINLIKIEAPKKSLPNENNRGENTTELNKTDKEEKLAVKIYYRGSLLQDEDEKAILSYASEIIDLNENPDIPISNTPNSIIYKITTEFQFKTHFLSPSEEIIRLYCNIGSSNISGTTSVERWISKSKLNEMRFHKKYPCTAWFTIIPCGENKYSAEFLLIGEIKQ